MGSRNRSGPVLWTVGIAFALSLLLLLGGDIAHAKKPPKPPPPPPPPGDTGVIYFEQGSGFWQMDPDDGAQTELTDIPQGIGYDPSSARHGGERWFLQRRVGQGGSLPGSRVHFELHAVSESGTAVLLFDDPAFELGNGNPWPLGPTRWATDNGVVDGKISFTAQVWIEDPDNTDPPVGWALVEWGIYVATLDPADLATAGDSLDLTWTRLPIEFAWPVSINYDWSPDGTSIAFVDGPGSGIWLAEEASPAWDVTRLTLEGGSPRWSHDGTRLAFSSVSSGIHTMNADGTGLVTVVEDPQDSGKFTNKVYNPCWSPNDTHLAYNRAHLSTPGARQNSWDIYRVQADGGNAVNLTEDDDRLVWLTYWSDDQATPP
ncbi:MAG: TolB family protein [Planctomycetota bacterium]|jgi:hypothetical protein